MRGRRRAKNGTVFSGGLIFILKDTSPLRSNASHLLKGEGIFNIKLMPAYDL